VWWWYEVVNRRRLVIERRRVTESVEVEDVSIVWIFIYSVVDRSGCKIDW
jgi:hypothetical protein